jgi:hypothetical protein
MAIAASNSPQMTHRYRPGPAGRTRRFSVIRWTAARRY